MMRAFVGGALLGAALLVFALAWGHGWWAVLGGFAAGVLIGARDSVERRRP